MDSIIYCGNDFGAYCTAERIDPAPPTLIPVTHTIPGRPGACLRTSEIAPRIVLIRLFTDAGASLDSRKRDEIRRALNAWLTVPEGGELAPPGDYLLTYRDAVVTDVEDWDPMFGDAGTLVEFTCFDPIAYGTERAVAGNNITVKGTWPTKPSISITPPPSLATSSSWATTAAVTPCASTASLQATRWSTSTSIASS